MKTILLMLMLTSTAAAAYVPNPVDDSKKWHMSLILSSDWQRDKNELRLYQAFTAIQTQKHITEKIKFYIMRPGHRSYGHFKKYVNKLPAVVIQRHDGWVAIKLSGRNCPDTITKLMDKLQSCWPDGNDNPWDRRPRPNPYIVPKPNPYIIPPIPVPVDPNQPIPAPPVPDKSPKIVEEKEPFDKKWLIYAAIAAAAIFLLRKK